MNDKIGKTAVIVPAHNEEKVIAQTLIAILKIAPAEDIYVIDDGSTDNTRSIALKYTSNVLTLTNHGKAHALNYGIKHFNLTTNYEFIFFLDADTKPKEDFLEKIYPHFEKDSEKELVCVVGRVKGEGVNWITKYRQWEYQISQSIHKKAQMYLKNIVVTPGCATVYRSFIFDKLEYPDGTLTEDMDFTFMMHRSGFNNIGFETNAIGKAKHHQTKK